MSKKNIGKYAVLAMGSVFLIAALIALSMTSAFHRVEKETKREEMAEPLQVPEPMNILIMGNDRAAGLSDVLMLVHVDLAKNSVFILQIPRDTYAAFTDGAHRKLNTAVRQLGGEEKMCEFLSASFGIPVDHYVSLDLDVLSRVVDAIGGVEVDLPEALDYEDPAQGLSIHLPAGKQILDGARAEQFVRYRSGYLRGDLGRMDAQKLFLTALFRRCRESMDLLTATQMATVLLPELKTDLTVSETVRLCETLFAVKEEAIEMLTLPGEDAVAQKSGAWYYVASAPAVNEVLTRYFGASENAFDPERLFRNERYESFCRIYDGYSAYEVDSAQSIGQNGIGIEKTHRSY